MLQPKRVKYRRPHRLSYEGVATKGNTVEFGEWGLQALEGAYITDHQIESARIVLARATDRTGKIWIRIFPHLGRTKKPAEVRMGSGKGSPEGWAAPVKAGKILFEIGGVSEALARDDYAGALAALAELKAPIDRFFEDVLVMDEDTAVRENRLRLLNRFVEVFVGVADIGALSKKK